MANTLIMSEKPLCDLSVSTLESWAKQARALDANRSLFPDWVNLTAQSHNLYDSAELIMVHKHSEPQANLAMYQRFVKSTGIRLKEVGLVSNLVSYHNAPISILSPNETTSVLLSYARSKKADVLHIAGLDRETEFAQFLDEHRNTDTYITQSVPGESSPYLAIKQNWTELIGSKPKKFRYKIRKREESLKANSNLEHVWYSSTSDVEQLMHAIQTIEDSSWKQREGLSIFQRETEIRYHELLLPFLASINALVANVLFYGKTPIAYNLCCESHGWIGQLKTSFNQEFSKLSPGSIVIDQSIKRAIDREANEFDFLGKADQHKLAWSKEKRNHVDYFIYLKSSLRGRALGALRSLKNRIRRH